MEKGDYHRATKLVQNQNTGEEGAVNKPIYQSTSFAYETPEQLEKVFKNQARGFVYSRVSNPTNNAFERKMVELEGGIGAVSTSSGMAAISTAILALVQQGDEIVAGSSLFGGTYNFLAHDLSSLGVKTNFVQTTDPQDYRNKINQNTRLVFLEAIGNPGLDVPDIKAISRVAHQQEVPLFVDNTFLTPYLFCPGELGADVVVHSTSKFINGSANSLGGMIVDTGSFDWTQEKFTALKNYFQFGDFSYLSKIRQDTSRNLGGCASPFNSFLNNLGLGTLGLRMEKHCENARLLAQFLQKQDRVKKVNYPGLPSHPDFRTVTDQFAGQGGGLLTFELADKKECFKVLNELKLAQNMAHLGDIRTLVIHPASTIYASIEKKRQQKMGVTPGLIRVSVGIEDIRDIIDDFSSALSIRT